MKNVVLGVEIPVKDLNRAMKFYSQVMGVDLQPMEMGPTKAGYVEFHPNSHDPRRRAGALAGLSPLEKPERS